MSEYCNIGFIDHNEIMNVINVNIPEYVHVLLLFTGDKNALEI